MKKSFIIISVLLLTSVAFAENTVEMRFVAHIGSNKSDDIIHVNGTSYGSPLPDVNQSFNPSKHYITAHETGAGVVLGLVSTAKRFINITLTTNHTASDYLLSMKQNFKDNGFLIVFTQGTYTTIDDDWDVVNALKFFATTFAGFSVVAGAEPITYLILHYDEIDLHNSIRWAGGAYSILMKNKGDDATGRPRINFTLTT